MVNKELNWPFYAKAGIFLVSVIALFAILYIAQSIIVPVIFATIIAIVLHPVVNLFVRFKVNRVLAIIITLLLTLIVIAAVSTLMYSQMSRFSESWPVLIERFTEIFNQTTAWTSGYFEIDPIKIQNWVSKFKSEVINTSGAAIGHTLLTVGSIIVVLFLIPVYVFIILYYQPLLREFIHKLFKTGNQKKVEEIITQTKSLIQRYLVGLTIEAAIVAALDTMALLIIGIDYAIMLGIIAAILNIIPYIGGLIAVALPMMVAIATKSSAWYAVYVLLAYYIIQLIDNNYIVPKIVASKVKINALFSLIVVLAGNALWGIPGMFLSLPLLAIVKLICDNIESLKPWGYLLGDTMPAGLKIKPLLQKLKDSL